MSEDRRSTEVKLLKCNGKLSVRMYDLLTSNNDDARIDTVVSRFFVWYNSSPVDASLDPGKYKAGEAMWNEADALQLVINKENTTMDYAWPLEGNTVDEKVRDAVKKSGTDIGIMLIGVLDKIDNDTDTNIVLEYGVLANEFIQWWDMQPSDEKDNRGCSLLDMAEALYSQVVNGVDAPDYVPEVMKRIRLIEEVKKVNKTTAQVAGAITGKTIVLTGKGVAATARTLHAGGKVTRKFAVETGIPATKKGFRATMNALKEYVVSVKEEIKTTEDE